MKRNTFLLCAFLFVFTVSSCTTSHSLYTSQTANNETFVDRGKEYQTANTSNLKVIATGLSTEDDSNRVIIGIENKGEEPILVKDSQFSIFGGNSVKGKWEFICTWNASSFYEETRKKIKTEIISNKIAGVLSVIDASFGSTSTSTVRNQYGTSYVTTNTYNPSDVAITAMLADISNQNLEQTSKQNLEYLEKNLLFSSTLDKDEIYAGIIYFPSDRKYPDYKITFSNQDDSIDFVFSRTDREEVLHPWTTDSSRILNSITINFSLNQNKTAINYMLLLPHSNDVGLYSGLGFYNATTNVKQNVNGYYYSSYGSGTNGNFSFYFDPDPTDTYNATYYYNGRFTERKTMAKAISFPLGITYKIFDHTWILGGLNFLIVTESFKVGTLEYSANNGPYKTYSDNAVVDDDFGFGCELQLGMNFAFNFIDINMFTSFDFLLKRFVFDVGFGVAL